jgi:hypothetical protein
MKMTLNTIIKAARNADILAIFANLGSGQVDLCFLRPHQQANPHLSPRSIRFGPALTGVLTEVSG